MFRDDTDCKEEFIDHSTRESVKECVKEYKDRGRYLRMEGKHQNENNRAIFAVKHRWVIFML